VPYAGAPLGVGYFGAVLDLPDSQPGASQPEEHMKLEALGIR